MVKINGWELTPEYNHGSNTWNIAGSQNNEDHIIYLGHYVDKNENFYQLESFKTKEEAEKFLELEDEKWNKKESE